jgi:serine/threonine-protein kinase
MLEGERFVDHGELARGGMGSIRRVFDRHILRQVAVKRLERQGRSREDTLRFTEEAQITGQLDHPNIVPVHDVVVGPDGMAQSMTMKLVDGRTLSDLIRDAGSPPPGPVSSGHPTGVPSRRHHDALRLERLLRVFTKVCEAVSFAHSRGVVHRDLKPSNIMVGAHGQVYVMDWGVARLRGGSRPSEALGRGKVRLTLQQSTETEGTVIGTVTYMAPEQAAGEIDAIDERTDVFGLGALLYAIITGRAPYQDADGLYETLDRAQRAAVTPPETYADDRSLPPGLCAIALKAMSFDPNHRYRSVDDLHQAVEEFLRGGGWFAVGHFRPGELIVRQGDHGDRAYIIQRGTCRVFRSDTDEPLKTLVAGDVFGEMAVLTDRPRNANVQAIDDVTTYVLTREALEHELDRNRWLGRVIGALAARFREADEQLTAHGADRDS